VYTPHALHHGHGAFGQKPLLDHFPSLFSYMVHLASDMDRYEHRPGSRLVGVMKC
jgi:hypothetical protein